MDNTNRHRSSADISTNSTPFNQAYWVVPDQLMAGCYPGSEKPETNQQIELICSWVEAE
jgi:hypothetical protein